MTAKSLSKTQMDALIIVYNNNGRIGLGRKINPNGTQQFNGKVQVTHKALMRSGHLKLNGNTVSLTDKGYIALGK